jgi:hypothetical protein
VERGKLKSDSKVWSDRFEHRYQEELACQLWAQRMAVRDRAMAQPVTGYVMPDEMEPGHDLPEAANDFKPG